MTVKLVVAKLKWQKLYFPAHLVMENRNGLYAAVSVADATPATEPGVVI